MIARMPTISPRPRALAASALIAGTLASGDPAAMLLLWLVFVIPALRWAGALTQHLRFVGWVLLPMGLLLVVVWGVLVGAPPGIAPGSSPLAGTLFACLVVTRLGLIGGVLQLAVLSIPQDQLLYTLRHWGLRGESLAVAAGSLILWPEFRNRSDQILSARYARGLIRSRRLAVRFTQLPHLLLPLFSWALRSAIQRSEAWEQRGLIRRLQAQAEANPVTYSLTDALVVAASLLWLGISVYPYVIR
jgi:energy-coupling factor transporter transmembrane protein EcfT